MHAKSLFNYSVRNRRAAAALLLYSGAALGQPAASGESGSNRAQASRHFQRGYALSQAGAFEEASDQFEAAYALEPAPATLYNLGQAYAASGQPVEALDAFRKCLQSTDAGLTIPLRERVLEAKRVVQRRIGRLRVSASPPSATVLLDGHRLAQAALLESIEVKSGAHVIVLQLEGFETQTLVVEIPPARDTKVAVALKPRVLLGHLMISCPLPDVEAKIDGIPSMRRTPLVEPIALTPGHYVVRLSRLGYHQEMFSIEVTAGKSTQLSCSPEVDPQASAAVMGTLFLEGMSDIETREVTVYVDGRQMSPSVSRGSSPTLRLPTGQHNIQLQRRNYEPWSRAVNLRAGAVLALKPHWLPTTGYRHEIASAARNRSRWAVVAWGAGAAIGVSSAVLGFAAVRRQSDWLRERDELNQKSVSEPLTLVRLRDNQQRALSIQRLNDAAIGLGVLSAGLLGAAAVIQWTGESTFETSSGRRPQSGPATGFTIFREGAYFQVAGQL